MLHINIKQSLGEQLYAEARLEHQESTKPLFKDSYRIVKYAASPSTWVDARGQGHKSSLSLRHSVTIKQRKKCELSL